MFSQVAWGEHYICLSSKPFVLYGGLLYTMVTGRVSTPLLVPFEFHCWLGLQTKGKHMYTELLLATSRPFVPRDDVWSEQGENGWSMLFFLVNSLEQFSSIIHSVSSIFDDKKEAMRSLGFHFVFDFGSDYIMTYQVDARNGLYQNTCS